MSLPRSGAPPVPESVSEHPATTARTDMGLVERRRASAE